MIVTLKNQFLTVEIEDVGAQLASIRDADGNQYLWQGDSAIWPRRAPLLFPIIGRLKDGQYSLDGQAWTIPSHGFCRDALFAVVQQSETSVSFRLSDSEETRKVYPFAFTLTVTYTLEENRLIKAHQVENRSERTMLYELGGHDGFRAPIGAGEKMEEYAIRLPGMEAIHPYGMDKACMITEKNREFPLEHCRLPLAPMGFGLDTIILDEFEQRRAVLVDGRDRPRVTLDFGDFPYLGIWTADKPFDTNYICIEPWTTLPDAVFVGRELAQKPGIRTLAPGQSETLSYTTEFHMGGSK